MQRNRVQFQKGLSLGTFLQRYGSEPQCAEAIHKARWPRGYRCRASAAASRASARPSCEGGPHATSTQAPGCNPPAWPASGVSPRPAASTSRLSPAGAQAVARNPACGGSTQCSATSSDPSTAPTTRSTPSTCRATWRRSPTASTAGTSSPILSRASCTHQRTLHRCRAAF